MRYIILLRSVEPLEVYAYNRFWLRFANIPFSLEQLDVYEKHFTVMNYNDADLQQMFCHDFTKLYFFEVIKDMYATYPEYPIKTYFDDVTLRATNASKKVLVAGTVVATARLAHSLTAIGCSLATKSAIVASARELGVEVAKGLRALLIKIRYTRETKYLGVGVTGGGRRPARTQRTRTCSRTRQGPQSRLSTEACWRA